MNTIGPMRGLHEVMALRHEVLSKSKALQEVRATAEPAETTGTRPAAGFADALTGALQNVSAVQQRSSDMQTAYERGDVTDIAQVMLARQEAGVAFEATLQVRNKLLSAYQDIMRMGS
jgi:flagellar hook-basal body complex protein FliE